MTEDTHTTEIEKLKSLLTDEKKANIRRIQDSRNAIGGLIGTLEKCRFKKDLRWVLYLLNHPSVTILEKGELEKDDIKDAIKYLEFALVVLNQLLRNTPENEAINDAIGNINYVLGILNEILNDLNKTVDPTLNRGNRGNRGGGAKGNERP